MTLSLNELARVRQPMHFVWGERDPFGTPDAGEAAVRVTLDARLTTVAAGHLPWVDEPDRCAAVVQALIDGADAKRADYRPPVPSSR